MWLCVVGLGAHRPLMVSGYTVGWLPLWEVAKSKGRGGALAFATPLD